MRKITPILSRIKKILDARTDKEMTKKWGISYSTLDTWKNRDKIPEKRLVDFSLKYGVSFDWLLTGEGEMYPQNKSLVVKSNHINGLANSNIAVGENITIKTAHQ